jgi:hypothetical protein
MGLPNQLEPPVMLLLVDEITREELDPGVVFESVHPWFGDETYGT